MNRLIFLNRYFYPDHSATSQMLSDLAFHLAAIGRDVHVITSQQLYNDHRARLPKDEIVRGVHIHRVPTTRFGRSSLFGRGFDYLSYYVSTWRSARDLARQNDILIAKTDPPLVSVLAMIAARRHDARLVNWLQDIYPEVAVQLGIPFLKRPISDFLSGLRNRSLNAAEINVVVGKGMGDRVSSFGIPLNRIRVIPNWSDDENIFSIGKTDNPLRWEWGLHNKFVIGYSGNLGRAHEYQTVLGAAERLRDDSDIVFLFVGGGHNFDELHRLVKRFDLEERFRFVPYQNQANLNNTLNVPDVHWISLRPELDGLIVPSKLYGIAAAGKPIIAITNREGEIARLVRNSGCGVVIETGDDLSLAEAIIQLKNDPDYCTSLGRRARLMLDREFTREHALEKWRSVIDTIH